MLYNYDFDEKDGRHVSIKSGDECILIQKTNDEWWFVLRCGEKHGIFVPANHLQEIHKTTIVVDGGGATGPPKVKKKPTRPPPVPKKPKPPLIEDDVLKELDNMLEHALDFDDIVDEDEEMTQSDVCADESAEDENDYMNVSKAVLGIDANANKVKKEIHENCVTNAAVSLPSSDTGDGNNADCRTMVCIVVVLIYSYTGVGVSELLIKLSN